MTDTVTQQTMWLDAKGVPFASEDQAVYSNNFNDLTAFLGGLGEWDTLSVGQVAAALLANYTMTPKAPA